MYKFAEERILAVPQTAAFGEICSNGKPYNSANGTTVHCSAAEPCPADHFCHIGVDLPTTVCCQRTCKFVINDMVLNFN